MVVKSKKRSSVRDSLNKRTSEHYSKKNSAFSGKGILDLSDYEDVEWFKLKKGVNLIDIIPYEVKSDKHPEGVEIGELDYVLDVWVHKNVGAGSGSFVCLEMNYNKACPICEEVKQMEEDEISDVVIGKLEAKRRVIYNVIDLDGGDEKILIYESSHFEFQKELLEEAETDKEGEFIVFSDLEDGRTIKIKGRDSVFKGRKYVQPRKFDLIERDEIYDEDIIDKSYPLDNMLVVFSYDEMRDLYFGVDKEDEIEKSSKKKSKKKEDEIYDDKDDGVEEIEKSSKKKREKKKINKDNEEEKKNLCPYNHKFGDDCEKKKDCDDCDEWDACSDVDGG